MSQKAFDRTCGFCGRDLAGEVGRYVYPVPGDPAEMDNRVGLLACADCGVQQYQRQVEQGLVVQIREGDSV